MISLILNLSLKLVYLLCQLKDLLVLLFKLITHGVITQLSQGVIHFHFAADGGPRLMGGSPWD